MTKGCTPSRENSKAEVTYKKSSLKLENKHLKVHCEGGKKLLPLSPLPMSHITQIGLFSVQN
jgi:hypothetical protein